MRRLESAHVLIDGSDAFEEETARVVEQIARSRTGQAVIEKIRAHGWVIIEPFRTDKFNAYALNRTTDIIGLVIGSIEYSPSTFATIVSVGGIKMPNHLAILNPGFKPDEVLLHEMVHAGRVLGHQLNQIKLTGAMANYDNEEEFFAVLVSNIYLSEKGTPSTFLRASHQLTGILNKAKAASEVFLFADDNYRLIEKFCEQHPRISKMLQNVRAQFNPIRAYYEAASLNLDDHQIDLNPIHDQVARNEALPALTDDYLISILKPRYQASDVARYGARARKLEQIFGTLRVNEAMPLSARLLLRNNGDLVAGYFHHHLATVTREKLLTILNRQMTRV